MPRPSSTVVARRFRASSSETAKRSSARSSGAPRVVVARAPRGARFQASFARLLVAQTTGYCGFRPRSWPRYLPSIWSVQAGPPRALRRRLAHAQRRERGEVRLTLPPARARLFRLDARHSRGCAGARTWARRAPTRRARARCVPPAPRAPRASRPSPAPAASFERRFAVVALNQRARVPLFPDARRSASKPPRPSSPTPPPRTAGYPHVEEGVDPRRRR